MQCCIHPMMTDRDGTLWIEGQIVTEQSRPPAEALQAHGPDGPIGAPLALPAFEYRRWTFRYDGRELEGVPNAPAVVWTIH